MKNEAIVAMDRIEKQIYLIRGKKVMLSLDLAGLYGVEVRALAQAVRRNTLIALGILPEAYSPWASKPMKEKESRPGIEIPGRSRYFITNEV